VRRSFERQVALFSGPDSPFATRSGSLAWIEPLSDDMIVLDVACGAAHASEPLASVVRQVVGVDLTSALLGLGAQRLREAGIGDVLLQEGNAESLPFVDESFDVVFCRSSLHHFGDPERAVAEMVRVCRVGGRLVLVDLVAPTADIRGLFDHVHRLVDPSHVRSFLEREIAQLLPGGVGNLVYGDTSTFRLPIDVAFTEQSDGAGTLTLLMADPRGEGLDRLRSGGGRRHHRRVVHDDCRSCRAPVDRPERPHRSAALVAGARMPARAQPDLSRMLASAPDLPLGAASSAATRQSARVSDEVTVRSRTNILMGVVVAI
jgi:SAM-dependent methyltransferase